MKIVVVGTGYVGFSLAVLLAQYNKVIALDISEEKINTINNGLSPIKDRDIDVFLATKVLNLTATTDSAAYVGADYIVIATPTDYDPETNFFDTGSIEKVIENILQVNLEATIIIKSTVPVGYVDGIRKKYNVSNVVFSPEFLREGFSLHDNLYPSRIVVGELSERAKIFSELLLECSLDKSVPVSLTHSKEAEAIKLFSNTYLAMRIAYFNELDSYCASHQLNAKQVIDSVCLDSRIGSFYNNPSFGYGGYCLPKDTKQLLANYDSVPQSLIGAVVESNHKRKAFIVDKVMGFRPKVVGVYRLVMKSGSDNFRSSAIIDIIDELRLNGVEIIIYEPTLKDVSFMDVQLVNELNLFKLNSDLILANRFNLELNDVMDKVFTRDLYMRD